MFNIKIRFYEELNDFLPTNYKFKDIDFSFMGRRSIKDLIEALGVPHVEVDLILANGNSVNFSYIIKDNDRFSIYPVFESISIKDVTLLRPRPLRVTRFVVNSHLGKLTKNLRMLGFDSIYQPETDITRLAELSENQGRILLTRNKKILMINKITRGLFVRSTHPKDQVVEILNRLELWSDCNPLKRCLTCNGNIFRVQQDMDHFKELQNVVPRSVLTWCHEYFYCNQCRKIYWNGSHYTDMKRLINEILRKKPKGN
jgi:uncharacterized protein with PIN domain